MPKQQKKPPSAKAKAKAEAEAEQQEEEEEYAVEEIVDKRLAKDRTVPSRSLCLPALSVPPPPPPTTHRCTLSAYTLMQRSGPLGEQVWSTRCVGRATARPTTPGSRWAI
eukprot:COSAG02_NODE_68_length_42582_cov_52.351129_42_plen_110_part_00